MLYIMVGGSSENDEFMYYCHTEDGRIAVLVAYVDDIILLRDYRYASAGGGLSPTVEVRGARPRRARQAIRRGIDSDRRGYQTRPSSVYQEHRYLKNRFFRCAQDFYIT